MASETKIPVSFADEYLVGEGLPGGWLADKLVAVDRDPWDYRTIFQLFPRDVCEQIGLDPLTPCVVRWEETDLYDAETYTPIAVGVDLDQADDNVVELIESLAVPRSPLTDEQRAELRALYLAMGGK